MTDSTSAAILAAQHLLRQFMSIDGATARGLEPEAVRAAVAIVAQASEYQILGVCADNAAQGFAALNSYLAALGYAEQPAMSDITAANSAIYIKYNPKRDRCYTDRYTGAHRGVLVSCQSAYEHEVNETFGHLPLDLFS